MSSSVCPRCGEGLGEAKLHEVEMRMCPGCQGLLVEQRRLVPLLDAMAAELLAEVDLDTEIELIEDAGPVGTCPACGGAMDCDGYMGSKEVQIDRCGNCWSLWIDPMEFGAMSMMYARAEKKVKYVEEKLAEAREKIQLSGVHAAERMHMYNRRLPASGLVPKLDKNQAKVLDVLINVASFL